MSLPRFGVTKPVPINLLMVAILLGGIYSAFTLRREFFPEMDPEMATVSLPYPGATPEEIEQTLAKKVEDAIADLDEVDEMTTTITEGGGGIMVTFREGLSNVREAVDEVERTVDALTDLPDEAERIQVAELKPRMPVIMLTLFGETDEAILKSTIRMIRDELKTLPNMGEILVSGARNYEIRVDVAEETRRAHGLSLPQISDAISQWMADVPGGTVRSGLGNVNIRTIGTEERAEAIRQIIVKATADGQVLRVGDIASVHETFVDEQLIMRFNGAPSVSLTVFKTGSQDIVKMAEMVRAYALARNGQSLAFNRIEQLLNPHQIRAHQLGRTSVSPIPAGLHIATHSDLARFVEGRLALLTKNALYGAVLVFGTLLFFLNWRVALWVGAGLCIALAGALMLMKVTDITLNLLTMFGLIVVLGLLVDDAIVVAENIQARHDKAEPALVSAIHGAEEVTWPVFTTVLTTVVAFLPLTFIRGRIGDLLGALPIVVAVALLMSLIESLLILPSHMGHSLKSRDMSKPSVFARITRGFEAWRDRLIFDRIVPFYSRVLETSIHHRYLSITAAVAVLIISFGMVVGGRTGFVFLPSSDSETVIVNLRLPIGSAIESTNNVVQRIEEAAQSQPEIRTVTSVIGQRSNLETGSAEVFSTHVAQMFIELTPVETRDRVSSEVIASIRESLVGKVDDIDRISFEEMAGGPGGADFTYRIRGDDEAELIAVADKVKRKLGEFDGVLDIADDHSRGQREVQIKLKPGAAALGFSVADVARQVRGALHGLDAHVFSDRQEDIDVRVRLDEQTRRNLYAIENMWLISPAGKSVPLGEIAELTDATGYSTITRVDRKRTITVTAAAAPGVSPEAITAALNNYESIRAEHPTVEIMKAGRQEQMSDAFATLPLGFLAATIMIYVILAWLFSSYTQPLGVMMAIPFGLIGVIWGHILLGFELTFLSLIGFVALSGIIVNDSLILVHFYNHRREEGDDLFTALIAAGKRRLRPIFLTTITTVLGLTPLMLETSFQARFLIPMAISISFGLMSGTLLILLVLPCILVVIDDLKRIGYYLWYGQSRETQPLAV